MSDNKVQEQSEKSPTFAILGAGFSGLGMAIRLRQEGVDSFTIYEKASEVGGTWRENTYPGVTCDVPSHLYSFSFAPNPHWSQRYAPGSEIWDYLKHCALEHDLYRSIQFDKRVTAIRHNGEQWEVNFSDGGVVNADYVISGLGGLHEPSIPEFDGMEEFTGPVFHTARWRHDLDLKDKRVAVIGSAASAIQVIPEIAKKAAHLDIYQRTPNWVLPRKGYQYPEWIKRLFRGAPMLARAYRGFYFTMMDARFRAFHKNDNAIRRFVRRIFHKQIQTQVRDPQLREKLTPDYPIGCKRILISDDYLQAIQRPNVELVTSAIDKMTPAGLKTADGQERPADLIVLATGFKPFDILESIEVIGPEGTGPGGASLKQKWTGGIAAHRTVAVDGFPNFFMLMGPNSGLGHNSVILMIEAQVNYILSLIKAAKKKNARFVQPTPQASHQYNQEVQADLQNRVWANDCGAWYVDTHGRNYTLYPHPVRKFLRDMAAPVESEFRFVSSLAGS